MNLNKSNIKYSIFGSGVQLKFIFDKNLIDDIIIMFDNMRNDREYDNVIIAKKFNL